MISYFEAKIFSADSLKLMPDETVFTGKFILKGGQRQIRLIETPSGHTTSDLVVWLEMEGLIFARNFVFSGYHPSLEDGNL